MAKGDPAASKVKQAAAEGLISGSAEGQMLRWLSEPPFARFRTRLVEEIEAGRWRELDDAFYTVLEFGTGGRRGQMFPVGTNVLNDRTIAESARGLADYIASRKDPEAPRSCVIARDARHNSEAFAETCARVLVAAGFRVFLLPKPRSTPLLSFAVRHLNCDCGIMITASHNQPSDNGFKCYARTGGQVIPPDDAGIIERVRAASEHDIPEVELQAAMQDGRIRLVGDELDRAFIAAVVSQSVSTARDVSIVFTPLHGVGESACGEAILADGFTRLNILESERTLDPDFTHVPGHVSNPEIPQTLEAAITEARATGAELVIASDPDADRIGVAVPATGDPRGDWTCLTGNQIGVLLTAFVVEKSKEDGKLRPEHYLITTLVTTQMAKAVAARHGVRTFDELLVGFKWIGQQVDEQGPDNFLFGFEESHGYVKGTHVRDKDAAVAAMLFAELAADCKSRGQSVLQYLDALYLQVGHFGEHLINVTLEGRQGAEQIKALMAAFRERPPTTIAGLRVLEVYDYKEHVIREVGASMATRPLPHPSGDLLIFHLDAPGVRFAARPSGTEPKIKFYLFARSETGGVDVVGLAKAKAATTALLEAMAVDIDRYIGHAVTR